MRILFIMLWCLFVIETNAQTQNQLSEEQKHYLLKFVYPLDTYDPSIENTNDLKILNKLVGNSKVVALGEVTHGSSEIFKMKDRIIRFLIKHNNFDIFSIEAAMPESYFMNNYIIDGRNDAKVYLNGLLFWTWNVKEVLDMVNWMKSYNETHTNKIKFTGFDMQHFNGALNQLKKTNTKNNISNVKLDSLKILLNDIRKKTTEKKSRITIVDSLQKKALNSIFESIRQDSQKLPDEDKKWNAQNIRIIEQYLDKSSVNRDKYMAENVLWIKNNNPNSKLIIWAHNNHIKKTETSMGKQLHEKLKDDYVTIGFTFHEGSYTAIGKDSKKLGIHQSQESYEGTLEYFLNSLEIPIFILDLKTLKQENNKLGQWLLNEIPYRRIGAMSMDNDFKKGTISNDFDYLIFIKESTNSTLLTTANKN